MSEAIAIMDIEQLHLLASELPTIMDLDDEIRLIKYLTMIEPREIAKNEDGFRAIVSRIQESHGDNGIFELTAENYPVFADFCGWLRWLQPHLELDVSVLCDGLDLSPASISASMKLGQNRTP